ncbi:MAG: hypothetical protein LBP50_09085 [Tannerella sp.]|nr:hypothetical protein [Tannerella sp.]
MIYNLPANVQQNIWKSENNSRKGCFFFGGAMHLAIQREKNRQIRNGNRKKNLIAKQYPEWRDLYHCLKA